MHLSQTSTTCTTQHPRKRPPQSLYARAQRSLLDPFVPCFPCTGAGGPGGCTHARCPGSGPRGRSAGAEALLRRWPTDRRARSARMRTRSLAGGGAGARTAGLVGWLGFFLFCFFSSSPPRRTPAQAPRWKMAGKLESLRMEPPEVVEEAEEAEGSEGEPASSRPEQEGGSLWPVTVMRCKRAVLRNKNLSFLLKKNKTKLHQRGGK